MLIYAKNDTLTVDLSGKRHAKSGSFRRLVKGPPELETDNEIADLRLKTTLLLPA